MSISKLSLVVLMLIAGTALSVRSYLESRRPVPLEPRLLVRELPGGPIFAVPIDTEAAVRALENALLPELPVEECPVPEASSTGDEPALTAAPTRAGSGQSRWIKVRRNGEGRRAPSALLCRPSSVPHSDSVRTGASPPTSAPASAAPTPSASFSKPD